MKYINLIILGCIAVACSQKPELNDDVTVHKAYRDTVPVAVSEYKINRKFLNAGMEDIGWPELRKHDSVGIIDTLPVKRIDYRYKKIFIYTEGRYADTLTVYKDSVSFSDAEYTLLESKTMLYNGKKIKVHKYQYYRLYKHTFVTVDMDYLTNRYVNDSLGIVFEREGTGNFAEYDIRLNELQKAILRDTLFNKFQFDYKKNSKAKF